MSHGKLIGQGSLIGHVRLIGHARRSRAISRLKRNTLREFACYRVDRQREMPLRWLVHCIPTQRREIRERARQALAGRLCSDEIRNAGRSRHIRQRFTQYFVQPLTIEFAMLGRAEFAVAKQPQGPDFSTAIRASHDSYRILLMVLALSYAR